MKFNIGDIVIGNESADGYVVTGEGFIGEVIKIHPADEPHFHDRIDLRALYKVEDRYSRTYEAGKIWSRLDENCFDLYKSPSFSLTGLLKGESQ